jgi:hypothetical protein
MPTKKIFGGTTISFAGHKTTLEELFPGTITTTDMIKFLWAYIRKHDIMGKGEKGEKSKSK